MSEYTRGDSVTVTTENINGGDPFEGEIVSFDGKTDTVAVEPASLEVVEMAIVGLSEVDE